MTFSLILEIVLYYNVEMCILMLETMVLNSAQLPHFDLFNHWIGALHRTQKYFT